MILMLMMMMKFCYQDTDNPNDDDNFYQVIYDDDNFHQVIYDTDIDVDDGERAVFINWQSSWAARRLYNHFALYPPLPRVLDLLYKAHCTVSYSAVRNVVQYIALHWKLNIALH